MAASPFTWQSDGEQNYTTTEGNNGIAVQDYSGETTNLYQPTSEDLDFEYDLRLNESDPNSYRDASLAQLFYTANFYHDVLYDLGFNEEAGNFQKTTTARVERTMMQSFCLPKTLTPPTTLSSSHPPTAKTASC